MTDEDGAAGDGDSERGEGGVWEVDGAHGGQERCQGMRAEAKRHGIDAGAQC